MTARFLLRVAGTGLEVYDSGDPLRRTVYGPASFESAARKVQELNQPALPNVPPPPEISQAGRVAAALEHFLIAAGPVLVRAGHADDGEALERAFRETLAILRGGDDAA